MEPGRARIVLEGFLAGLIGFVALIAVHAVISVIGGHAPYHTVAMLGRALVGTPESAPVAGPALAFNGLNLLVFLLLGLFSSAMIAGTERRPVLWYVLFFILIASFIYGVGVMTAFTVRGGVELSGWTVMGANVAAAAVMGAYFWHGHPRLWSTIERDSDPEAHR